MAKQKAKQVTNYPTMIVERAKKMLGSNYTAFELFANKIQQKFGIPSIWLYYLADMESGFRTTAQSKASSAYGLFQLIDSTAKQYKVDKRTLQGQFAYMENLIADNLDHIKSPADLYILNFYPKFILKPGTIIDNDKIEKGNPLFVYDGKITYDSVANYYNTRYGLDPVVSPSVDPVDLSGKISPGVDKSSIIPVVLVLAFILLLKFLIKN